MGSIYGKPIKVNEIQRRAARFVISDYQNYELGSVTTLLKDLGWKFLKNRREVDRLCLLKKGLDNSAILPLDELSKPARKTRHTHNRYYTTIYARTNILNRRKKGKWPRGRKMKC